MIVPSDVCVFGVVQGGHYIEDIRVHVPQNVVITIPSELALKSHDLWKAIAQKVVFRAHVGPHPGPMQVPPVVENVPSEDLASQNQALKASLEQQRELTLALRDQMAEQTAALAALTKVIAQGGLVQPTNTSAGVQTAVPQVEAVVAPTFIPAVIRPEGAETRINTNTGESEDSGLAESRSRLRKFRQ